MAEKHEDKEKKDALGGLTIEEGFAKLEDLLRRMEQEDVSLEDSFRIYEEGMRLLSGVNARIGEVEEKIRLIDENGVETGELADLSAGGETY